MQLTVELGSSSRHMSDRIIIQNALLSMLSGTSLILMSDPILSSSAGGGYGGMGFDDDFEVSMGHSSHSSSAWWGTDPDDEPEAFMCHVSPYSSSYAASLGRPHGMLKPGLPYTTHQDRRIRQSAYPKTYSCDVSIGNTDCTKREFCRKLDALKSGSGFGMMMDDVTLVDYSITSFESEFRPESEEEKAYAPGWPSDIRRDFDDDHGMDRFLEQPP